MAETLADFFDEVAADQAPAFRPEPWYNEYGDCIHFHWRKDSFYRDFVDDKLTIYRSNENNDAVGCQIKGVHALLKKLGDFGISIKGQDGTPLALFVFVSQATGTGSAYRAEDREQTYRYLIEQVAKQRVEVPVEA